MSGKNYLLRPMSWSEVATLLGWAAQEGWNPGLHDALPFHVTDPLGFWGGFLYGQLIASISVVRYNEHYGFVGLYIVKPEYRGQGYGWLLWKEALRHLEGCHTVGIDGFPDQQETYERSGFHLAYHSIRYCLEKVAPDVALSPRLLPIQAVPFHELLSYDRHHFPTARPHFLSAWLAMPGVEGLVSLGEEGIQGYGVIRPCQRGYKIGPLFATNEEIADEIFTSLCHKVGQGPIFLDLPQSQRQGLVVRHDLKSASFEVVRMYRGTPPLYAREQVFGVTSFELG